LTLEVTTTFIPLIIRLSNLFKYHVPQFLPMLTLWGTLEAEP
jgi:hypothetical protein